MDISVGLAIGLAIAFVVWRLQARHQRLEEQAYRLFVDFHAECNRGDEAKAQQAWSRYLQFFADHNLNAAAFHDRFKSRIDRTCRDAKEIGDQRAA